jgi:cell division transport system permease protein
MQTLEFQLSELFTNLRRNGLLTIAAVITVMSSMVVFGLFNLANINLQHLLDQEARKAQISAFLGKGLSDAETNRVRSAIEKLPGVQRCEYVSSQAAFDRLTRNLESEVLKVLKDEGPSRLPAKFSVQPKRPEDTAELARQLKQIKGVSDVRFGQQVVETLNALVPRVRRVGLVALVLMVLATSAIIGNAIRLTIYARRREIRIMQLVGATNGFIRAPFVLEGLCHGLVGGALAVAVTFGLYGHMQTLAATLMPWLKLVARQELLAPFAGSLIALGALIGLGSSLVSMRHFLKQA